MVEAGADPGDQEFTLQPYRAKGVINLWNSAPDLWFGHSRQHLNAPGSSLGRHTRMEMADLIKLVIFSCNVKGGPSRQAGVSWWCLMHEPFWVLSRECQELWVKLRGWDSDPSNPP